MDRKWLNSQLTASGQHAATFKMPLKRDLLLVTWNSLESESNAKLSAITS